MTIVTLPSPPAGSIQVSSMDGINSLAALTGGVIFTYTHMINSTLQSVGYYAPYGGQWFFFVSEANI